MEQELDAMLLQTEKRKFFTKGIDSVKDDVGAYCTTLVGLPPVGGGTVLKPEPLCRFRLLLGGTMDI